MRRKNKGVNITFSLYPARRRPLLAPPCRQSLNPPSGHANRAPRILPGAGPCWRRPAGKALIHRRATPTGRPLQPKACSGNRHPAGLPSFPKGPFFPAGCSYSRRAPASRRVLPAAHPPHSNRNLVGNMDTKSEK